MRISHSRSFVAGLLRDARIEAGLTQTEVACRLGVPQSFVSKYETGERRLDVEEVQTICRVLGSSLVEFAVALEERQGRGTDASD